MGKNCLEWVAAMPPSLGGAGGSCYRFPSGQTQTGVPTISLRDKEYTTSARFKMAKVKSKPSKELIGLVKEYGSDILSTDNTVLFCKACGKTINHEKNSKSQFLTELCMAFIDARIPLWILGNKSLRGFLEKYTKQHIPSESSLRKNYIDNNFNNVMDGIRRKVTYNKIWVSVDETIDPVGRFVANVVIGTLEADQPSKEYLLTSEVLEKSNSSTIAQLFTSVLAVVWPEGIRYENVLLFLLMQHPHGLHRIAEHIRCLYPDVDRLISNVKNFSSKHRHVWGTWLSAVFHSAANFTKMQEIIGCFEEEESAAVKIVHEIMQKESLLCDLVFIASNFANFVQDLMWNVEP
ncbi:CGG triplet repeat-binding protein [Trichinella spiralis]|uniref:CGG triplet repeat-binding protein n=1 Tax=Trichinella spiralis TaxID=6334 RepID=A0ABR3K7A7_TRISP